LAWNNNNDPKRDISILQQVAFKGAVEYAVAKGLDLTDETDNDTFGMVFGTLAGHLNDAVNSAVVSHNETAVKSNFKGTTEADSNDAKSQQSGETVVDGITVKSWDGTDIPDWLIAQAKEAGCTAVWDNRADSKGTKKPLFKAADGTKNASGKFPLGFWAD